LADAHDAVRTADDREVRRLHVDGHEERKALDVVPVIVREEQREARVLLLHDEVVAEPSQPGARVEHDAGLAARDLHAARVPANGGRVGPGRCNAPAHAPETDLHDDALLQRRCHHEMPQIPCWRSRLALGTVHLGAPNWSYPPAPW